jgi:hypothetical protein
MTLMAFSSAFSSVTPAHNHEAHTQRVSAVHEWQVKTQNRGQLFSNDSTWQGQGG